MSIYTSASPDASAKEIRLARLLPGKRSDAIIMETYLVALQDRPAYKALSYTWGSLEFSHEILVNGIPFRLTANLDSALRHIRSENESLDVWIDLICINQEDLMEKASQVSLMGEIFRLTNEVLIWLGDCLEYPDVLEVEFTPFVNASRQHMDDEIKSGKFE